MRKFSAIVALIIVHLYSNGQVSSYNFRSLTTNDGLSDGVVRAITQDKYGFIWIGTSYGLNRFDGVSLKTFFVKKGDSTSLPNNYIRSLYSDTKGNLWIGTLTGFCRFDYRNNCFVNYKSSSGLVFADIHEDKKGTIWLGTSDGLWFVDQEKLAIAKFKANFIPGDLHCAIIKIAETVDGDFCLATNNGIRILNVEKHSYREIKHDEKNNSSLGSNDVYSVAIDRSGYLWAACAHSKPLLHRIDLKSQSIKPYYRFSDPQKKWTQNVISNLLADDKGRIWGSGNTSGLFLYDDKKDSFFDFKTDPLFPNSMLADQNISMFQDGTGNIWLGTAGYGVSYFNPDKNLFYTILPIFNKKDPRPGNWCRSVCEDKEGSLWLATGSGVAKYDRNKKLFTMFVNEDEQKPMLHLNSVRALLTDDNGDIWIGTAQGLNRYHPSTGVMDFFTEKQGMPLAFFWMIAKTSYNDIWFGSAFGLYHYLRRENRFDNLVTHPLLSKFSNRNVQALFIDSKDRIWIGLLDIGVVIYDPAKEKITQLTVKDSLITDTRFSSFVEDKKGIIWIGSENGLTAYDPVKHHSIFYSGENGLPSTRTNNLMVDKFDRLWIGTSNGLCVMNRDRNRIHRFDIHDGLPANQFNEQSAFCTHDGLFVFPTYKGFAVFRPEDYKESNTTVPLYITSFKISEKELKTTENIEELKDIQLHYDQNFFSIELAGLNFMNPSQCTYAYKLEPFDKDWIYTQNKQINYTNVPAGDYTFHYKVITDNPNWNVKEKSLQISIAAVFYETWWFRLLVFVLIVSGLVGFYRYRMRQKERILLLKNKAQMLEKEKALVMYESLKQQLNPHFLFNSLTSLSSLIQQDQKVAKQFLDQMSKIYRYILQNRDSELVPLIDDVKLAEVYTRLQQTRFQQGLKVNMNVSEDSFDRKIVPVSLQNLIENAIKHNIIDIETPLVIDIFTENGHVVVRNNLQKKNFVETSNKQGLANMTSLYHYLTGKAIIVDEAEKYFTVKIPLV